MIKQIEFSGVKGQRLVADALGDSTAMSALLVYGGGQTSLIWRRSSKPALPQWKRRPRPSISYCPRNDRWTTVERMASSLREGSDWPVAGMAQATADLRIDDHRPALVGRMLARSRLVKLGKRLIGADS